MGSVWVFSTVILSEAKNPHPRGGVKKENGSFAPLRFAQDDRDGTFSAEGG